MRKEAARQDEIGRSLVAIVNEKCTVDLIFRSHTLATECSYDRQLCRQSRGTVVGGKVKIPLYLASGPDVTVAQQVRDRAATKCKSQDMATLSELAKAPTEILVPTCDLTCRCAVELKVVSFR
jgi:spore germination protein GerM